MWIPPHNERNDNRFDDFTESDEPLYTDDDDDEEEFEAEED